MRPGHDYFHNGHLNITVSALLMQFQPGDTFSTIHYEPLGMFVRVYSGLKKMQNNSTLALASVLTPNPNWGFIQVGKEYTSNLRNAEFVLDQYAAKGNLGSELPPP
jgi:hypothetical protein